MKRVLLVLTLALALAGQARAGWWDDPQEGAQRRTGFWHAIEEKLKEVKIVCMRADEPLDVMLGEGMKKVFAGTVERSPDHSTWVEFWMKGTGLLGRAGG